MPIRTSYPHGTPSRVELHTNSSEAARAFYSALFGWRFEATESATDPRTRAYLDDVVVAAISPLGANPPGSPAWISYLAVDDINTAVRAVSSAGGRVVTPPYDRADHRAVLVTDPTDALVGLWQAYRQPDATLFGEPATVAWFELLTDDPEAASAFYQQAFALVPHAAPHSVNGIEWTTLQVGGDAVAGLVGKQVASSPNRWNVYFAIEDIAGATRRAVDLGATVTAGPVATGIGPMAGIQDPNGAHFSLWTPALPGR